MKSRSKSGFTLVEILIVVVILGILAAIVIPQFSQASTEARTSSVASNLQMIRSQVELYKIQHGDAAPATGDLEDDLTGTTTYGGQTFGPYMQKWPVNAVTGSGVITEVADMTAFAALAETADDSDGWVYVLDPGLVYASDDFTH